MALQILIVEDDSTKLQKVIAALLAVSGITLATVRECRDAASAKKCLIEEQFDLLVLDIAIPSRLDVAAVQDGGFTLLEELVRRDVYRRPQHVVLLTAYAELIAEVPVRFPNQRWTTLLYDLTSDTWSLQLRAKAEHIIAANNAERGLPARFESEVGIICALDEPELSSILRLPWKWQTIAVPHDHSAYYHGHLRVGDRQIRVYATSCPRMGLSTAAVQTMKLLHAFHPQYIFMTGIAAGVKGRANLGDVIAAEMSWDYGSGKYEVVDGKPRFSVSPNIIRLDAGVRAHIKALAKNVTKLAEIRSSWPAERPRESLEVRIGPVASGAAVIANADKVREIEGQHRKIVGIDMEAYSLFEAANEATAPRPTAVCLKGVSDFADSEKSDNFQRYAAYTCAEVFRVLVEEYLFR
jgi:nucleoside phosphorylase/CheY-like chemotaxis protein